VSTGSTQSTKSTYSGIAANGAIVLIQVVTPMLDRQIRAQLAEFGDEGGFTENLYHYRKKSRDEDDRDEDE
jgi:four helix bundle suffix protein